MKNTNLSFVCRSNSDDQLGGSGVFLSNSVLGEKRNPSESGAFSVLLNHSSLNSQSQSCDFRKSTKSIFRLESICRKGHVIEVVLSKLSPRLVIRGLIMQDRKAAQMETQHASWSLCCNLEKTPGRNWEIPRRPYGGC